MPFTQEELAEMAAADREIEASFELTADEIAFSRELDWQDAETAKDCRLQEGLPRSA